MIDITFFGLKMQYSVKFYDTQKNLKKSLPYSNLTYYTHYNGGIVVTTNDIIVYSKLLLMDESFDVNHIFPKKDYVDPVFVEKQKISNLLSDHTLPEFMRKILILTNNNIDKQTSTCNACGDTYNHDFHIFSKDEHIRLINKSWGYHSTHDGETHQLTLCNGCYDKYIMCGPLRKFIKRNNYM